MLAAFLNALRLVDKKPEDVKVVVTGIGAAGVAVTRTLMAAGVRNVVGCDSKGAVYRGRDGLDPIKERYAAETNPDGERGGADEVLRGADVYIGLSVPGAVSADGHPLDGAATRSSSRWRTRRPRCRRSRSPTSPP